MKKTENAVSCCPVLKIFVNSQIDQRTPQRGIGFCGFGGLYAMAVFFLVQSSPKLIYFILTVDHDKFAGDELI